MWGGELHAQARGVLHCGHHGPSWAGVPSGQTAKDLFRNCSQKHVRPHEHVYFKHIFRVRSGPMFFLEDSLKKRPVAYLPASVPGAAWATPAPSSLAARARRRRVQARPCFAAAPKTWWLLDGVS